MNRFSVGSSKELRLLPFLFFLSSFLLAETPEAFSPELFPGLAGKSDADIRLAGIAALNPGRILDADPAPVKPPVPEMRKTLVAELPRGGEYLRLYALDTEAVKARAGKKPLIVDCRYLATSPEDAMKAFDFGVAISWGIQAELKTIGGYPAVALPPSFQAASYMPYPVVVLVNGRTSGPLEAVLAAVQSPGRVLLVGANTAGMTGAYIKSGDKWILSGEVKPDEKTSLVGVGATPKFPVKTTPQDEFYAWQLVERGVPLSGVLRHDGVGSTSSVTKPADAAKTAVTPEASDLALQRAQEVLAALAVLGAEGK